MNKRALAIIGSLLALLVITIIVNSRNTGSSSIKGSLLNDQEIAFTLKARADANNDSILTAKEIRRTLVSIIRGVILGSAGNDINGDGSVNHYDIADTVKGFRALLLSVCGNEDINAGEECDDGNLISGDGCSGLDFPNGACLIEFCGDGYTDTDGIPDGQGGQLWAEQCDNGGLCDGGINNGKSCTSFGGDLANVQCPEGFCVPQSFDGCQNNCLLEICGNATFEPYGIDGKPGIAGTDDDDNGVIDDNTERWAAGSDDEDCDEGGRCSLSGHDCLTSGNADICRQNGGTCQPMNKNNGCFDTCKRDIWNFLNMSNINADADGTSIPVGNAMSIGVFRLNADLAPAGYMGYQIGLADFIFTVHADNVSVGTSGIKAAYDVNTEVACTPINANGETITTPETTGIFYVRCSYNVPSNQAIMTLGSDHTLALKMTVINAKISSALPSSLQVLMENVALDQNIVSVAGSHIRWVAANGPQMWPQFRLKNATNTIASTLYGDQAQVCGDGKKENEEACDDNDTDSGDGCSASCTVEANFRCTGSSPSVCQSYLDFVRVLADTNSNGTVSENEALSLILNIADAPGQPYSTVSQYDIDNDGDMDNIDLSLILTQLDILAPE